MTTLAPPSGIPAAPHVVFAGLWRRVAAWWIDLTLVLLLAGVLLLLGVKPGAAASLGVLAWLIITGGMTASFGGTPGKLLLRARAVRVDGTQIDLPRALLREAVLKPLVMVGIAVVVGLIFAAGFGGPPYLGVPVLALGIVLLSHWRGWLVHDRIVGSVVVHERILPDAPDWGNRPPWREPRPTDGPERNPQVSAPPAGLP